MPTPANPAPDRLTPFENNLCKPRAQWSKAEWRAVAMQLASVVPTSKRGRPALTDEQRRAKTENLLVAEFWRDQEREFQTKPDGSVIPRTRKLTKREATTVIVRDAVDRHNNQNPSLSKSVSTKPLVISKKTAVLIRDIQTIKKNHGKNKDLI